MTRYYQQPGRNLAGQEIGILLLETFVPLLPGNVANQATFPFPVRYKVIPGASPNKLLYEGGGDMLPAVIESARELVRDGVRAISAGCGYFARFQEQVAEAVDVPVFLTSLLQAPFITRGLKRGDKVGIICADAKVFSKEPQLLRAVGIDESISYVMVGLQECPEFAASFLGNCGSLDHEAVQQEVCGVVQELVARHPEVRSLLFECSDLPPYAWATQLAVRLPIWDYSTLIRWVYHGVVREPFDDYRSEVATRQR